MAKGKSSKNLAKNIYDAYKEKLWELIIHFIEEEIKNIATWIDKITHLKQKIKRIIGSLVLLTAGVVVVLLGLGELIASMFAWEKSISYIFVGFLAIIVAIIYSKS